MRFGLVVSVVLVNALNVGCSDDGTSAQGTGHDRLELADRQGLATITIRGEWDRMICRDPEVPNSCRAPEPAVAQLAGDGKIEVEFLEPAFDTQAGELWSIVGKRRARISIERPAAVAGQPRITEKHASVELEAQLVNTVATANETKRGFEYRFVSPGHANAAGDLEASRVTLRVSADDKLVSVRAQATFMERAGDVVVLGFTQHR